MTKEKSLSEKKIAPEFSDAILREVYMDLISKHKNESERQHLIRAVIGIYQKKYPSEMRAFGRIMDEKRETLKNDYAADKEQRQRLVFKFPESLMKRFTMLVDEPPLLSASNPMTKEELTEWTWFIKEFPQFVVPKKI